MLKKSIIQYVKTTKLLVGNTITLNKLLADICKVPESTAVDFADIDNLVAFCIVQPN